jgi:RimJ/RimL family protein N-acetyltransferase
LAVGEMVSSPEKDTPNSSVTGFQTVLGVCPSLHHAAIQYNRRIGLREIGRIPGAHLYKGTPCDAILYALTKEEWSK